MEFEVYGIPFCSNLKNNNKPAETPKIINTEIKTIKTKLLEVEQLDKDKGIKEIGEKIKEIAKAIFIGGDHSISYALVKAIRPDLLVVFDAHADLIRPTATVTNEDWLRALIDEKIIMPKQIALVGLRSYDEQEKEFIKQNSIPCIFLDSIEYIGIDDIADFIMEKMKDKARVYLSIDVDVINGSEINALFREPFGLSSRQLLYILQRISRIKEKIQAIDIVEAIINDKPNGELTKKIVEKIIKVFK